MPSSRMMKLRRAGKSKAPQSCSGMAIVVTLLFAAGCQRTPLPPAATPRTSTEKLEALAAGLDDLLSNRRTAEGVTVQSKVTYRPIASKSVDAPPRAEITIETKRFFVLAPEAAEAVEESDPAEGVEQERINAEVAADTTIVKNSEKKVYDLVYRDDRWQLESDLNDLSEQILFDRALRMQ